MDVRRSATLLVLVLAAVAPAGVAQAAGDDPQRCVWSQWGQSARHEGRGCAEGQRGLRVQAVVNVEPFAVQEAAEDFGGLPVHFGVPLIDSSGTIFVTHKAGRFIPCDPPGSGQPAPCGFDDTDQLVWQQQALQWRHGRLVSRWTFTTDWKPLPGSFEGLFQPAMSGRYLFVPAAGGTLFQVDKDTGRAVRRIDPFGGPVDPARYVSGGITVDRHGTLYYNVVRPQPAGDDADSWLVAVSDDGRFRRVGYRSLIPGAPGPADLCYGTFFSMTPQPERPWPPAPQPDGSPTLPPRSPCLSQRAATNVAPAVGPDGTVYTVSHARSSAYAYVVALRPDLRLKWATSLRGRLSDGCGVSVPYGTDPADCRPGSTPGVDPTTNLPPAGQASDASSASPVALPDGSVLYGTFSSYNGFRGHLMKFDGTGRFAASYDFGWDITPAVYPHDGTYSVILKDNHYASDGPYRFTSLDAGLHVEWSYTSASNTEWCISAPAVDRAGNVYGASADGNLYVLDRHGHPRQRIPLGQLTAEAYTPVAIDPTGRVYAQNNGDLYALAAN